jgi:hypothetical protein
MSRKKKTGGGGFWDYPLSPHLCSPFSIRCFLIAPCRIKGKHNFLILFQTWRRCETRVSGLYGANVIRRGGRPVLVDGPVLLLRDSFRKSLPAGRQAGVTVFAHSPESRHYTQLSQSASASNGEAVLSISICAALLQLATVCGSKRRAICIACMNTTSPHTHCTSDTNWILNVFIWMLVFRYRGTSRSGRD